MGCRCGEAKLVGQRVLIIEQQAVLPPANGEVQVNTQVAKMIFTLFAMRPLFMRQETIFLKVRPA